MVAGTLRPLSVYLVERDPVALGLITAVLEAAGLEVIGQAGTVAAAATGIARCRPDVVVVDTRLPDGVGFELCRYQLGVEGSPPIVLHAASLSVDEQREAARYGAALVGKNVRGDELIAAIRACGRRRPRGASLRVAGASSAGPAG